MTELEMLSACLERESELDDETREAFWAWHSQLVEKRYRSLTQRRRAWLDAICKKLEIEPGSANLVSSGKVKPLATERESLAAFHASLGPKPLRPPGR